MNAAADRLDDSFPHGTLAGYDGGCKGSVCPAGADHGLSCQKAKLLQASDYRYAKLVRAGRTPGEIADELGLNPDPSAAPSKPTPAAVAKVTKKPTVKPVIDPLDDELDDEVLDEHTDHTVDALAETAAQPLAESSQDRRPVHDTADEPAEGPASAERDAEGIREEMGHLTVSMFTKGLSQRDARTKGNEIREWMRANGWPGVGGRGNVPQEALAAYAAAHLAAPSDLGDGRPFEVGPPASEQESHGEPVTEPIAEEELSEEELVDAAHTIAAEALAEHGLAERSDLLDETRARIAQPERPQWGEVAAAADVEKAREIAARLFLELTDAEAERDQAQGALELTLQKWSDAADRAIMFELRLSVARGMVAYLRDWGRVSEDRATEYSDKLADANDRAKGWEESATQLAEQAIGYRQRIGDLERERDRLRQLIEAEAIATPRRRRRLRRAAG